MADREQARAEARKKYEERKRLINKRLFITIGLMYLALITKDLIPYSWVLLIPTTIYCLLWTSANADYNHRSKRH